MPSAESRDSETNVGAEGTCCCHHTGMANIQKVQCLWQNFPGAPGYTNFFFDVASPPPVSSIVTFWTALQGILPSGLTVSVPNSGDEIDPTTGKIVGSWSAGSSAVVTMTAAAAFSGGSGAVIHWLTSSVVNGHRVRGKSFIVPLTTGNYDSQGNLSAACLTTLRNAAAGLVTAGAGLFSVYRRPTTFTAGNEFPITGSSVPDLAAVLRSRRT